MQEMTGEGGLEVAEQATGEAPRPRAGPAGQAARPVWEVPEPKWGPYLPLVFLRVPDFKGPATRLWIEGDEAGDVVGLLAENASGQQARVAFDHPPVVASETHLAPVPSPVLH